jgi:hypothetical protein
MAFEVGATLVMIGLSAAAASGSTAGGVGSDDALVALQAPVAPAPAVPPAAVPPAAVPPAAVPPAAGATPPAAARKPAPNSAAPNSAAPNDGAPSDGAPSDGAPSDGAAADATKPAPVAPAAPAPPAAEAGPSAPAQAAPEAPPAGEGPSVSAAAAPDGAPVAPAAVDAAPAAPATAEVQAAPSAAGGLVAQAPEAPPSAPSVPETPVPSQPMARGGAIYPRDKAESARVQPQNALPPGQIAVPGGFSIAVGTQMSFGQSTFQTGSSYARDPMVDWSLSLSPSFMFPDGTRISAGASLSQELTESNGDDDPGTFIFSDIGLNASRSLYRFEHGPQIFGSLAVQIPTSEASRVETLRTSLGARVSASQPIGGVFLSVGSGFRKNFHEYTVPTRNPNTGNDFTTRDGLVVDEILTGIARNGGSELAGATYFEGESNNTSMVWSNSLSVFWPATEKLGFGASYNLSHSWTYEGFDLDELSGVGARAGRGRRDSHGGSFFANYQALDHLAFGLGMATGGPTRTADDKRIRFPFFNVEGPESNMTTFFISATYTESISL